MNNEIKAIIFDVDGVLLNSTDSNGQFHWLRMIEQDLGISISETTNILFKKYWSHIWDRQMDTPEIIDQF